MSALVRQALLPDLEGDGGVEDCAAILLGNHPAGGKTVAVANRVHLIDDLLQRVTGAQEIAVHGVGGAILGYRLYRGVEGLGEYLPAKNPRRSPGAFADKQVFVDGFDFEVGEQFFQIGGQGNSPAVPTDVATFWVAGR
jgi:hypothetical protein